MILSKASTVGTLLLALMAGPAFAGTFSGSTPSFRSTQATGGTQVSVGWDGYDTTPAGNQQFNYVTSLHVSVGDGGQRAIKAFVDNNCSSVSGIVSPPAHYECDLKAVNNQTSETYCDLSFNPAMAVAQILAGGGGYVYSCKQTIAIQMGDNSWLIDPDHENDTLPDGSPDTTSRHNFRFGIN